jgi:hypothetical protein
VALPRAGLVVSLAELRQIDTSTPEKNRRDQGRLVEGLDQTFRGLPGAYVERWKPARETITAAAERPTLKWGELAIVNEKAERVRLYLPKAKASDAGRRVGFFKRYPHQKVELVPADGALVNGLTGWSGMRASGIHEIWWTGIEWATTKSRAALEVFDFGAVGDGVTDDQEAIQEAITTCSAVECLLVFPAGFTFRCDDKLTLGDSCFALWQLDGVLDFQNATDIPGRDACINFGTVTANDSLNEGGLTALPALGAHANEFDQQVTFTSAHGLVAGDLFIIQDADNQSWNANLIDTRNYYRRGDYLRVRAVVSSTVVQIDTQLFDTYLTTENIDIWKVSPNRIRIFGSGKVICPGTGESGILVSNGYKSRIEGIEIVNVSQTGIDLWRCYETSLIDVHVEAEWMEGPVAIGDAVSIGASIVASYDTWTRGGSYKADKHALTVTGGGIAASIPSRHCGARGTTLRADVDAGDMHGHCEHCSFINCEIDGGVRPGGDHSLVDGCTIFTCADIFEQNFAGLGYGLRECKGCHHTFRNSTLHVRQERSADTYPIDLNVWEAERGGKVLVENVQIKALVHNALVLNIEDAQHEDLSEYVISGVTYSGPSGAKAAAIRLATDTTGAFKDVLIEGIEGLSVQTDTVRTRRIRIRDFDVSNSDVAGIVLALSAYTGVDPLIEISDGVTSANDENGIYVDGAAVANDVDVVIKGVRAVGNGVDTGASGSARAAIRAVKLRKLEITGNTLGGANKLFALDTITTVMGSGNQPDDPAVNYGTDVNQRSLTSITNDLEVVELRGSGSPESSVYGCVGWTYINTSDGSSWRKFSGSNTNTGWRQATRSVDVFDADAKWTWEVNGSNHLAATAGTGASGYVVLPYVSAQVLQLAGGGYAIAGGAISPTNSWVLVDTEGAAATDDLDTINLGAFAGGLFILQAVSSARTVVVKHNTGNILCPGAVDFSLDNVNDKALCFYDSNASKVCVLAVVDLGA